MLAKRFFFVSVAVLLAACVRDGNVIRFDPSVFGGSSSASTDGKAGESGTSSGSSGASASGGSRPREKLPPGETWQGDDNYTHYRNRCMKGGDKECDEFADALIGKSNHVTMDKDGMERVRKDSADVEDKIWGVSAPEKCDAKQEGYNCGPLARFMQIFPDGGRHAEAAEKQCWIGANKKMCENPQTSGDCSDFEFYVERFPKGPKVAEAKKIIAKSKSKLDKLRVAEEQQAEIDNAAAKERRKEKIREYCPRKNGDFVSESSYCSGRHGQAWHRCLNEWRKCPL
jgi:hypothetical protein